jgi:small subunit ribosomal protein S16|tara:strand:+ start:135 stop:404 length:270 start_codon:yes stop_codon:yes gene_type:complete
MYVYFFKNKKMLKLRLKRGGRKGQPAYRVVVMESTSRRDGRPIENLGYYNPISKEFLVSVERISIRLKQGVKPTRAVENLLKRAGIAGV